jgi:hypothetical protein
MRNRCRGLGVGTVQRVSRELAQAAAGKAAPSEQCATEPKEFVSVKEIDPTPGRAKIAIGSSEATPGAANASARVRFRGISEIGQRSGTDIDRFEIPQRSTSRCDIVRSVA